MDDARREYRVVGEVAAVDRDVPHELAVRGLGRPRPRARDRPRDCGEVQHGVHLGGGAELGEAAALAVQGQAEGAEAGVLPRAGTDVEGRVHEVDPRRHEELAALRGRGAGVLPVGAVAERRVDAALQRRRVVADAVPLGAEVGLRVQRVGGGRRAAAAEPTPTPTPRPHPCPVPLGPAHGERLVVGAGGAEEQDGRGGQPAEACGHPRPPEPTWLATALAPRPGHWAEFGIRAVEGDGIRRKEEKKKRLRARRQACASTSCARGPQRGAYSLAGAARTPGLWRVASAQNLKHTQL
eukprot:COSAG04_NODE_420_length_14643_cov_3.634007_12_plen_296_part_00